MLILSGNSRVEKMKVMSKAGTSDMLPCLGVFLVQLDLAVPSICGWFWMTIKLTADWFLLYSSNSIARAVFGIRNWFIPLVIPFFQFSVVLLIYLSEIGGDCSSSGSNMRTGPLLFQTSLSCSSMCVCVWEIFLIQLAANLCVALVFCIDQFVCYVVFKNLNFNNKTWLSPFLN